MKYQYKQQQLNTTLSFITTANVLDIWRSLHFVFTSYSRTGSFSKASFTSGRTNRLLKKVYIQLSINIYILKPWIDTLIEYPNSTVFVFITSITILWVASFVTEHIRNNKRSIQMIGYSHNTSQLFFVLIISNLHNHYILDCEYRDSTFLLWSILDCSCAYTIPSLSFDNALLWSYKRNHCGEQWSLLHYDRYPHTTWYRTKTLITEEIKSILHYGKRN